MQFYNILNVEKINIDNTFYLVIYYNNILEQKQCKKQNIIIHNEITSQQILHLECQLLKDICTTQMKVEQSHDIHRSLSKKL